MWHGEPSLSPAIIGVPRRSLYNSITEASAIRAGLSAARGIIQPFPIIHGGKLLGLAQGKDVFSDEVRFIPWPHRYRFGWSSWNDCVTETAANGKSYNATWFKNMSAVSVVSNWVDLWGCGGDPTSGSVANTANTATNFDNTTTGAIVHGPSVSTDTKHVLSLWLSSTANTNFFLVLDRVLAYDQNNHNNTVSTVMTNTNTAQRYNTGSPGLNIACVSGPTVQGATATDLTVLTYVDQSGNTGHTMPTTPTVTFVPSAAANATTLGGRIIAPITSGQTVTWGPFLPLANGDAGARSVTNYTTSSANTGNFSFVLCHVICGMQVSIANLGHETDQIFHVTCLERVIDGACLQLFAYTPNTTAGAHSGSMRLGWG